MNTPETKPEFLMLFRGKGWDEGLSPEELRQAMDQITAWMDGLKEQGKMKGGQALGGERRIVSAKKGRAVVDGPFAESKEAVGGSLLLEASSLEEVLDIASACPMLKYGVNIEVRAVLDECPTFKRAQERLLQAPA